MKLKRGSVEGVETKCPCCGKDLFVLMKAKGSKIKEFRIMEHEEGMVDIQPEYIED